MMEARSLADRLKEDLQGIRWELEEEVRRFAPEEIDWTPRPGMRSCRGMLEEIGVMEAVCAGLVIDGVYRDEDEVKGKVAWVGNDPTDGLAPLTTIHAATLSYLDRCTDDELTTAREVPGGFGGHDKIEPEEIIRWIARHEYYHFGQLVIYRWMLGDNPYQRP